MNRSGLMSLRLSVAAAESYGTTKTRMARALIRMGLQAAGLDMGRPAPRRRRSAGHEQQDDDNHDEGHA